MNKDDQLKIELFQQSLNQPASFILDLKTGATLPYILIEALKKKGLQVAYWINDGLAHKNVILYTNGKQTTLFWFAPDYSPDGYSQAALKRDYDSVASTIRIQAEQIGIAEQHLKIDKKILVLDTAEYEMNHPKKKDQINAEILGLGFERWHTIDVMSVIGMSEWSNDEINKITYVTYYKDIPLLKVKKFETEQIFDELNIDTVTAEPFNWNPHWFDARYESLKSLF